jgi:predicted O-methyltransferase YrrM
MYSPQILINYFMHRIRTLTDPVNNSFIHDFKNHVLNKSAVYPEFRIIEKYRSELSKNTEQLEKMDMGAGSKSAKKGKTVGSMARTASVSETYGQLLYRLAGYYKPDNIIELGTALGVSTMYLALGNPQAMVYTVEGNPQLAAIASNNFARHHINNITLINNSFDNAIARLIPEINSNTLVFIDGNHTLSATLKYFGLFGRIPGSSNIFIFDDINWSNEMMRAWESIAESPNAGTVVDLFQMGIIFQGRGMDGKKFRLWY